MAGFLSEILNNDIDEGFVEEDTQRGRYLTFLAGGRVYGLPIRFVDEIIGMQAATKVPETPDYVKGIVNRRGRIIPLIDMRLRFGMDETPSGRGACIIVANVPPVVAGLIVDGVEDILRIDDHQIELPPPAPAPGIEDRYVEGVYNTKGKALLLLGADKLLPEEETESAAGAAQGTA